jgi:hypothetical protein
MNLKTIARLLVALMLGAAVATPAMAAGEADAADCKAGPAGDKSKPRQKVAPGSAQPGGEASAEDCKAAPAAKSATTRKQVRADAKTANKAREIPAGEASAKK